MRAAVPLGTALTARGRTRERVEELHSLYDALADRPDLVRILRQAFLQLSDKEQLVRQEAARPRRPAAAPGSARCRGTYKGQAEVAEH
ncbi:hypothetical protein AB0C98_10645 [Streptomyces sp. NPDC048558]|uniref:hypothetical protein n=1 Tax=Streptomyces sp. NPDC048558 TaxID=3155759 RepID=UPI0033D6C528